MRNRHEDSAANNALAAVVFTVEIKGMKFVPDTVTAHKGDRIVFVNRDFVNHCVTEVNNAWTSSPLPSGQAYMMVANRSADYYCAIHKVMKGKIVVLDDHK